MAIGHLYLDLLITSLPKNMYCYICNYWWKPVMPIAMHWATGNEDIVTYCMWQSVYAYVILRLTDTKNPVTCYVCYPESGLLIHCRLLKVKWQPKSCSLLQFEQMVGFGHFSLCLMPLLYSSLLRYKYGITCYVCYIVIGILLHLP